MARPTRLNIQHAIQGWDADVNDNFIATFDEPFPVHLDAALTEANLQATFAAASYDKCLVWVNHTVRGYTLYRSTGSAWVIVRGATPLFRRSISAITTLQDYDDEVICGGTTYTVTLPAVVDGRMLFIKRNSSGTITLSPASGTIDGGGSYLLDQSLQSVILFSDGTNWFVVGASGASGATGANTVTSVSGVGSLAATTTTNFYIAGGTTYTLTLPTAAGNTGKIITVKRNSSGVITIDTTGGQTIDSAATLVLGTALEAVSLFSDGSNWWAF